MTHHRWGWIMCSDQGTVIHSRIRKKEKEKRKKEGKKSWWKKFFLLPILSKQKLFLRRAVWSVQNADWQRGQLEKETKSKGICPYQCLQMVVGSLWYLYLYWAPSRFGGLHLVIGPCKKILAESWCCSWGLVLVQRWVQYNLGLSNCLALAGCLHLYNSCNTTQDPNVVVLNPSTQAHDIIWSIFLLITFREFLLTVRMKLFGCLDET